DELTGGRVPKVNASSLLFVRRGRERFAVGGHGVERLIKLRNGDGERPDQPPCAAIPEPNFLVAAFVREHRLAVGQISRKGNPCPPFLPGPKAQGFLPRGNAPQPQVSRTASHQQALAVGGKNYLLPVLNTADLQHSLARGDLPDLGPGVIA